MPKPPLDLHAELLAPDGTRYRWASERTDPGERPQNINFASKRFEGWERGSCQLLRPIDRDWPDLGLFDGIVLVGYDGSVAYEGMLSQIPRSTPNAIGVEATGWMAHARDRRFREVYVDRDVSHWRDAPLNRRALVAAGGNSMGKIPATIGGGGVVWDIPVESLPAGEVSEVLYLMPPGLKIGIFGYRGTRAGTWTNFDAAALLTDVDDALPAATLTALTLDNATRHEILATPKRYGMLRASVATTHTPAAGVQQRFTQVAVYGNHGLPTYAIEGETNGLYVSDMIRDIAARWCPRLNTRGVQDTSWPVPQAAWLDRIYPYDAWLELNKYHLRELEVWEDRTLYYRPSDLRDYQWEVRTTDPGVQVELQGDDASDLYNYAVVQFQNVRSGEQDEVSPDTHTELQDLSVENPANRHGLDRELEITLSDPTDPDSAAQIGRALLAENNQPRGVGTITFKGHLRDRAGHWQQGWKVRAGQSVAVTNWPNNRPRLIGEVEWDHQTKTGTIAVDSTLRRVDAFLDRNATGLRAAGLAS